MSDDEPVDFEPELQHQADCQHPIGSCTCSRSHLLGEAGRLRERALSAEMALQVLLLSAQFTALCADNCGTCRALAAEAIDRTAHLYPTPRIMYDRIEDPDGGWPTEVSDFHAQVGKVVSLRWFKQHISALGHYTSTYCLHHRHGECRQECKHDETHLCNCWCHIGDDETRAAIERGIEAAVAGQLTSLGDFTQYLEDNDT